MGNTKRGQWLLKKDPARPEMGAFEAWVRYEMARSMRGPIIEGALIVR